MLFRSATLVATPSVIKGKEHQIRYSRNQFGQITQVTETGYSPTAEKLDDKTKPQELKRTTSYTYQTINGKSVLVAIADPLGNVTKYQWDAAANSVTQVTYPMGLTASMVYDSAGFNPNTPNNPTGRMVQTTGVDGQSTQVSYTAQGDIASWTRAGRTITTEQDMLGRTVLWKSNDGQSIRASYEGSKFESKAQPTYTLSSKDAQSGKMVTQAVSIATGFKMIGYEPQVVAMLLPVVPVAVAECLASGVCEVVAAGVIRVCATAVSVIRQLKILSRAYQVYDCVANGSCSVASAPSPTADSLTAGHAATNGDRTKAGYGGQCTPDEFDQLQSNKNSSCDGARGCNSQDSPAAISTKISKLSQCIAAREDVMNSCFAGGDAVHKGEVATKQADLANCLKFK